MRKSRVPVKYEDSETVVTCAVGMLKQWFESGEKLEMQERHRCSDLFDFQIQLPLLSFSQCSLLNDIMWTEEKTYILYAALVMAATSQIFVWPCAAGPVSGPTHAVGHGLSVELHRWDPGGLW